MSAKPKREILPDGVYLTKDMGGLWERLEVQGEQVRYIRETGTDPVELLRRAVYQLEHYNPQSTLTDEIYDYLDAIKGE